MATFVLVHGASGGGWTWAVVRSRLQAAGHEVFAPSLSGMGDRVLVSGASIDLDTHIADIANLLHFENLSDVILVGASYGGMVITGVADRMSERLARVVYLDAAVPLDGEDSLSLFPPDVRARLIEAAQIREGGGRPPPGRVIDPRQTPQPLGSMVQPIRLTRGGYRRAPRTFIRCVEPPTSPPVARYAERVRAEGGWDYRELAAPHGAVLRAPDAVTALLLELATTP